MIVFVSSPYAGDMKKNAERARVYSNYAIKLGHSAFSPHFCHPRELNPKRELGPQMRYNFRLIDHCDEVWCFGELTPGMKADAGYARDRGIHVRYFRTK